MAIPIGSSEHHDSREACLIHLEPPPHLWGDDVALRSLEQRHWRQIQFVVERISGLRETVCMKERATEVWGHSSRHMLIGHMLGSSGDGVEGGDL